MEDQKKIKFYRHENHPRPVTRRDFLAQSATGFSAYLLAPTFISLLFRERFARAYQSSRSAMSGLFDSNVIPFLVFDLAGGGALPGNFLVGKEGGPDDMLPKYDLLGWNPRAANALDRSFGIPMAANNVSQMLVGIKGTASPEALANLRMGSFLHFSQDDSSVNKTSALTLVSESGLVGSIFNQGLGTIDSASGGNSDVVVQDDAVKPLVVNTVSDVTQSVSFGSALSGFSSDALGNLLKTSLGMSMDQLTKYSNMKMADQLAQLMPKAFQGNLPFTAGANGIDARLETSFQGLYGINAQTDASDSNAIAATIVMNVLKGNSGPGCITMGGYDYHTGNQTDGDQADLLAGQAIGRAVQAAYLLGKPLFLQILTDGGLAAAQGTRNWQNDNGISGMTVIGYYDPKGPRQMVRQQVGQYTEGQGADRDTLIGSDPGQVAYAVFANYLNICGRLGDFGNIVGNIFDSKQLDSVQIFG